MARVRLTFVCSTFLLILKLWTVDGDPCVTGNYKSINDPYRSTKYELVPGEKAICDNTLAVGWYRFTSIAGGQMPTTKPEPYYCGTVAPIWMKGTHPTTKGQVIKVTACTNLFGRHDGCVFVQPISVKNCGNFFVYNLQPAFGCAMAYCAGTSSICWY
jgi:hypothetical protein